jgi:hypothetical protein
MYFAMFLSLGIVGMVPLFQAIAQRIQKKIQLKKVPGPPSLGWRQMGTLQLFNINLISPASRELVSTLFVPSRNISTQPRNGV